MLKIQQIMSRQHMLMNAAGKEPSSSGGSGLVGDLASGESLYNAATSKGVDMNGLMKQITNLTYSEGQQLELSLKEHLQQTISGYRGTVMDIMGLHPNIERIVRHYHFDVH